MVSIEHLGIIVALIASCFSLLSFAYLAGSRLAKLEVKVDTMWQFQLRRATARLVTSGEGTLNSPIKLNVDVKQLLGSLATDIRNYYIGLGKQMSDLQLSLLIENKFGKRIVKEFCIPKNLDQGECLIYAVAAAKDTDTVDI